MKTPRTPTVFLCVALVISGVALAGGAWPTVMQTLQAGPTLALDPRLSRRPQQLQMPSTAPAPETPAAIRNEPIPAPRDNLLFNRERLLAAKVALETLPGLAGYPLRVFDSINFYDDGRINLELVDPHNPAYVDAYHFSKGSWIKGKPVNPRQMGQLITLSSNSAALRDIDFEAVARVAAALKEQREALMREPEIVEHVYLVISKGNRLRWLPEDVSGDREAARIDFDAQGNSRGVIRR